MAQIDFSLFIPHLFWFVVLFICFYFLIFSFFLPSIFESLWLRKGYSRILLNQINSLYLFYSSIEFVFSRIFNNMLNRIYNSILFLCISHLSRSSKK